MDNTSEHIDIEHWYKLGKYYSGYRANDHEEAQRWLRKAAEFGHKKAIALLADLKKSKPSYFQESAETCYQLGMFHFSGSDNLLDETEASKYLLRAAQKGHPKAIEALRQLIGIKKVY